MILQEARKFGVSNAVSHLISYILGHQRDKELGNITLHVPGYLPRSQNSKN